MNHKVKTIRCDNETEFKNKIMNKFCEIKGIRREFSVARTPQQNGVAKRKYRTLIEAAMTMLADSKLPTTFWAEAVNTACYVADDAGMKSTNVPKKKNRVQDPAKEGDKNDQEKNLRGQGEAANTNIINRLNTVSSSVNAVSSSVTAVDPGKERAQRNEFESMFGQDKDANGNRMFTLVSTARSTYVNLGGSIPVNAATLPNAHLPTDPLMPDLEDTTDLQDTGIFSGAYDDDVEGAEADFNIIELTTVRRTNHKDFQNYLFAYFLSQIEPKKVTQALTDLSWIEAMQNELLQFRLHKVWRLVDLPKGKHAIGTKWVYKNKKDKRGIIVKNKTRLVTQGYTQEEGIDYDEVFALVARIEAI
nr:putative ribonuclease H-like domain-containing protein [Tanacetum cinerariifolium]